MRRRWLAAFLTITVLATACSSGSSDTTEPGTAAEPGTAGTAEPSATITTTSMATTTTTITTTTSTPETTTTTTEPEPLSYEETIDLGVTDVEDFWRRSMPRVFDVPYEPVAGVVPYDSTFTDGGEISQCAAGTTYDDIAGNAFYCFLDDVVAFDDEALLPAIYDDLGPFAVALVLAHEWGHAIQGRTLDPDTVGGTPTVLLEGQADCYAGAWSGYVDVGDSRNLVLEEGDLETGLRGLLQVRDPVGTNPAAPGAHGSGFDRVTAFQEGFEGGVDRCSRWLEEPPLVTAVPFFDASDVLRGGDLPFRQIVELSGQSLDVYWSAVLDAYRPPAGVVAYDPDRESSLVACDTLGFRPDRVADYEGTIYYCADDRTIYYDRDMLRRVHRDIGDVGAGVLLSNAWAAAMQDVVGTEGIGPDLGLQADCFSGSWAGSIGVILPDGSIEAARGGPVQYPFELYLSPGDLDEVVEVFLSFGDRPGLDTARRGSGYERIRAFRSGFFATDPEATCASLVGGQRMVPRR